ncbi:MAG: hypothetical protein MJB57_08440, partial [Gemmatimonadetes bacterium]|nr:hypothetical protein [Gemmatimonadota bacterium]
NESRRRVKHLFQMIRSNSDVADYRLAQEIMAGSYAWLEEGIVGLQKAQHEAWRAGRAAEDGDTSDEPALDAEETDEPSPVAAAEGF